MSKLMISDTSVVEECSTAARLQHGSHHSFERDFSHSARLVVSPAQLFCLQCSFAQVLDKDGANVKALYRRAQAYLALSEFVEAETGECLHILPFVQAVAAAKAFQSQAERWLCTFMRCGTSHTALDNEPAAVRSETNSWPDCLAPVLQISSALWQKSRPMPACAPCTSSTSRRCAGLDFALHQWFWSLNFLQAADQILLQEHIIFSFEAAPHAADHMLFVQVQTIWIRVALSARGQRACRAVIAFTPRGCHDVSIGCCAVSGVHKARQGGLQPDVQAAKGACPALWCTAI